jgi:hypothetical protein
MAYIVIRKHSCYTTVSLSHTAVYDNASHTLSPPKAQRIAQEGEARDPSHGCWLD